MDPKIVIITGGKNSGKSSFIKAFLNELCKANLLVGGIYSPAVIKEGSKIAIDAVNISTSERRQLAVFAPGWDAEMPLREWRFYNTVLQWGDRIIEKTIHDGNKFDVLIIDEIGYLELEKNDGWTSVFNLTNNSDFLSTYMVIREGLLVAAKNIWLKSRIVPINSICNEKKWISREIKYLHSQKVSHTKRFQKRQ